MTCGPCWRPPAANGWRSSAAATSGCRPCSPPPIPTRSPVSSCPGSPPTARHTLVGRLRRADAGGDRARAGATGRSCRCSRPARSTTASSSQWWGRMQRSAVSPGMARKLMEMTAADQPARGAADDPRADARPPRHRRPRRAGRVRARGGGADPGRPLHRVRGRGRLRLARSPGLADIEEFLTGRRSAPAPDRVLATVMFTDIVGSTEQLRSSATPAGGARLEDHDRIVRAAAAPLARPRDQDHRRRLPGHLRRPGPRRQLCAPRSWRRCGPWDSSVRAGLHTGECELRDRRCQRDRRPHRRPGDA